MALDLLEQLLPHVQQHIYPTLIPVSDWKIKVGEVPNGFAPSLNDNNWTPIHPPQANWGAYDTTFWFRSKVTIPPHFANQPIALVLDIPDGLLYVNGRPFQGLNSHHQAVILSEKARAGQTFSLAIQAYSGRKKEQNGFRRADLAILNPTARALFCALSLLRDLERFYGPGSIESKEIRELIRKTLIYLKYFKPEGEEYPNAIGRAHKFLLQTLEAEFKTEVPGTVHLIGHSHLDVVWLWTIREARRKVGRTFSSMLRLMEEFPEFQFAQSQPLLYSFAKSDYPELYKQIKERVSGRRWEPIGALWVEPDCQIPNGESLVRQIFYGKKFFREEFGVEVDTAWLPDSFGFAWSLPQLLAKSGIRYFFTTKLSWNDTTKFPHNSFIWKGIDGSKVLAHIPPVGLEGQIQPKDIQQSWDAFRHQEQLTDVLQTYGFGDGGGGPVQKDLHTIAYLNNMPAMPRLRLGRVQDFFKELDTHSKLLPEWNKELYLEKHRGVFTTQGRIKKANRESERLLYTAELFCVLASLNEAKKYPHGELEKAWKRLLQNQFHDVLSGTIIEDAATEAGNDFLKLKGAIEPIIKNMSSSLTKAVKRSPREFHFSIQNTLPWPRTAYVEVQVKSKDKYFRVTDVSGNPLESQIVGREKGTTTILCHIENIPPFAGTSVVIAPTETRPVAAEPWKASLRYFETPVYRVRMDSHGNFTSIHDKRLRREILKKGQRGNVLQVFHDTPAEWEAWDIDAGYESKKADILKLKSMKISEQGPLRLTLEIIRKSEKGSVVRQLVRFFHKSPLIEFQSFIKWADPQILLKAAFPLNVNASRARFEIPFGSIERPTKPKSPEDKAKFEVPVHQWMDISDAKFGVGLLNNAKYGCDVKESTLRLTLLRSPHYPHAVDPQMLREKAVTDLGEQDFMYTLSPHQGDWKRGETVRRARELNNPLLVTENADAKQFPSLIHSLPANINVDSVRKASDSDEVILRLSEVHGDSGRVALQFGYGILQASACDLMEVVQERLKPAKGKLALKFTPFEVKTLRIRFRPRTRR
ncbi:MAG: glycoside hydrolase family 38 C-terminal domain-containing protein [Bacteroidota bacterium]